MHKYFAIISSLLIFSGMSTAQKTGNSPYSRYGIGDIDRSGFSFNRAMGGISTGLRKANFVNYLNPASYTSQDSMSFVFDLGGSYNYKALQTTTQEARNYIGNVDYLAASFPVSKRWAASFGLVPYSRVGYSYKESEVITDPYGFSKNPIYTYTGSGGVYQAYVGTAVKLFNRLSLGVNASYLFGSINHDYSITYPTSQTKVFETFIERDIRVGDIMLNYGLQYEARLSEKNKIIVGLTFDNATNVKARYNYLYYANYRGSNVSYPSSNDTITKNTGAISSIQVPSNLGIGLSYCYDNRLIVGFDYHMQDWSKARFHDSIDLAMKASNSVRFGLEYTPVYNITSARSYFETVHYRLGAQYNNTNLLLNGESITDFRISAGIGLPIPSGPLYKKVRNEFSIAAELGQRGTTANNLIRERYCMITCSFRFYEFWFYRRKYD